MNKKGLLKSFIFAICLVFSMALLFAVGAKFNAVSGTGNEINLTINFDDKCEVSGEINAEGYESIFDTASFTSSTMGAGVDKDNGKYYTYIYVNAATGTYFEKGSEQYGYAFPSMTVKVNGCAVEAYIGTTEEVNFLPIPSSTASENIRMAIKVTFDKVVYKSNNGTGDAPTALFVQNGSKTTAATTTLSRTGYTFKNWNTKSNGEGTAYATGAEVAVTGNVALYAQWNLAISTQPTNASPTVATDAAETITYQWKKADGTAVADATSDTFDGLGQDAGEYYCTLTSSTGETVDSEKVKVAAVEFDGNGNTSGEAPAALTNLVGKTVTVPSCPTELKYTNKKFVKWNDGTNDYEPAATYTIQENGSTLKAQWEDKTAVTLDNTKSEFTFGDNNIAFATTGNSEAITTGFKIEYYVGGEYTENAPVNAGIYTVKVSRAEDETYKSFEQVLTTVGETKAGLIINPKEVSVAWVEKTYTYNGDAQTVTASYKDKDGADIALTVTYGTDVVFKNVATYTATASFANNETNYVLKDDTTIKEYTINKFEVAVTWCTTTYTYNGQAQAVTATYADAKGNVTNLKVSYGTDVVFMNAGKYNAAVAFETTEEENNYGFKSDTTIAKEYSIAAKVVEIAWCANNFTYNGKGQEVTATYKDVANADIALAVSYGEGVTFKNAGNYTAKAAFANTDNADGNYALPEDVEEDYEIKKYTITIDWCNTEYTYTGSKQTVTASYVSFESATPVALSVAYSNVNVAKADFINAGNYKCTASFAAETDNYALPEVNYKDYTISPKEVEVVWCENVYEYNGKEQEVTAKYVDVKGADVALTVSFGDDVTFKNAGEYNATAAFANNETNYVLKSTTTTNTYNIVKYTIKINWCNTVYTYTGQAQDVIATYDNLDGSKDIALAITYSGTGSAFNNAGNYVATAAFASTAEEDNYQLPACVTKDYTMNPKEVKVVWCETVYEYNGKEQEVTAKYVDVKGADVALTVSFGDDVTFKNAGEYNATAAFANNETNYVLKADTTTKAYNIAKYTITINWCNTVYTYNGEAQDVIATYDNLDGSKDIALAITYSGKGTEFKVAGDYTATAAFASTEEEANYKLPTTVTNPYTMNKLEIAKPVLINPTDGKYPFTGNEITPNVDNVNSNINVTGTTSATTAGIYTAYYDIADKDNVQWKDKTNSAINLVWEIKELERKSADNSILLENEAKGFEAAVTLDASAKAASSLDTDEVKKYNLTEKEKVSLVYDIKLMKDSASIQPDGEIVIKMLIPSVIDIAKITKFIHYHDAANVFVDEFDPKDIEVIDGKNYYVYKTSTLSHFAFATDTTTDFEYLQMELLASVQETLIQLTAKGYDIDVAEEISAMSTCTTKAVLENAYNDCLTEINAQVKAVETYRTTIKSNVNTYATTKKVIVTADYYTVLETVNTTAKLDAVEVILKAEIDNVVAEKANLKTRFDAVDSAISDLDSDVSSDYSNLLSAIEDAQEAIEAILNDSTNGLAKINTNIDECEAYLDAAITTAKEAIVAALGEKTTELKNYIDALEDKLNTKFAATDANVDAAEEAIKNLVNTETSAIDTAVAELNTKVGTVETNLTAAIAQLKTDLVAALNAQTTELKAYVDTLEGKLNTKFAATDANVDAAEEAIKNLVNTETSAIDTAIAELDTKVAAVETNILAAIAQLKTDLVAELGDKTTELKNYIDALEINLGIEFDNVESAIETAQGSIESLVNSETDDIDTAIAALETNVAAVEFNLTVAIDNAKSEIVNELGSKTTELKNYIDALEDKLNTKFAATDANVDAAEEAIKNLVNTETSAIDTAIVELNAKVGTVETNILTAIAQLKIDLVAELGSKTTELKNYIDALEDKLNTKFAATDANVDAAEEAIKNLVNIETTAIDTAIAELNSKVGTVETNLTAAIANAKAEIVNELGSKTTELKNYIDALEDKLNTKFAATDANVDAAEEAIKNLVNTETSAIDTAIAALDTDVAAVETNILAAIAQLKTDLVAALNAQTTELKAYVDALEGKLNTKFTNTNDNIDAAEEAIKTLVNTETTAIDTAIAALDTKVGTVDTHVTNAQASINNAIISLKNELVSALATKTNELKDYTDALESSLNIKFNDVNTAIANAKTAITELVNTKASALTTAVNNQGSSITSLVNTETSAIDTAIAALDTKVGTVETNLKAALTSAENTLTALINAKKAELAEQVTAFKAEDKAAYEDTLAKIADLKAAVKATEEFLDKELGDSEDELTKSVKEAKDAVDASYESLNVKLAEYNDTFVADMNDKYMKVFVIICSIAALSLITLIIVIVKKNK